MTSTGLQSRWLCGAALAAAVVLLGSCNIYGPRLLDCRVKCAEDKSCPAGTTCETGFCRPDGAEGYCACTPGEERSCGGGQGECVAGVQRCQESKTWGTCLGEVKAAVEVCDNKDNDCDGTADEEVTDAPPCGKTLGVCAGSVQTCLNGAFAGVCAASDYGPYYEAVETSCDSKDNDCDGNVDGKSPTQLVATGARKFVMVGLDGGFALAWAGNLSGGRTTISGRLFNAAFQPLGAATTLGVWDGGVYGVFGAGHGSRAYFTWEDTSVWATGGASMDLGAPGTSAPLPTLPRTDAEGRLQLAAVSGGLMAAYSTSVPGVRLMTWPLDGGAPAERLLIPPVANFDSSDWVKLSSAGTTLYVSATTVDDAGFTLEADGGKTFSTTTTDHNVLMLLDGGLVSDAYASGSGYLFDTPNGLQGVYSYQSYSSFFFLANESALKLNFDVWNGTWVTFHKTNDYTAVGAVSAATIGSDWVAAWPERGTLFVGTPVPTASSMRYRAVNVDGGLVTQTSIGNAGSGLVGVAYQTDLSGSGVDAVLVCPP